MPRPDYRDRSSSSEDDFQDVDSSFNLSHNFPDPGSPVSELDRTIRERSERDFQRRVDVTTQALGSLQAGQAAPPGEAEPGNPFRRVQSPPRPVQRVAAPAPPPVPVMPDPPAAAVAFEDANGQDEQGALREACRNLERVHWDDNDVLFFFAQAEIKMKSVGVQNQFTKMQALSTALPKKVQDEVKSLLRKSENEFPANDAYKQLKGAVLRIFGNKPEDAIERALGRVLVGEPSSLARALVGDICKKGEMRDCVCCPAVVATLWKRQLSSAVRAGIAHCDFNADTFVSVSTLADKIHASSLPGAKVAAAVQQVSAVSLDETQPAIQYPVPEVAAIRGRGGGRGRGRGRGGGRGQNRGSGGQSNQSDSTGPKHKGTKPSPGDWLGCGMHFKFGKNAYFCSEPTSCPWKNVFAARPNK